MPNRTGTFTIEIRKRPWWFWTLAVLWIPLEVLCLQTALASERESEYRAAAIGWIAFGVLGATGVLAVIIHRRPRGHDDPVKSQDRCK